MTQRKTAIDMTTMGNDNRQGQQSTTVEYNPQR